MRNITVCVEDELYRRARVLAAERDTTVTGMVRAFLEREVVAEVPHEESVRGLFAALDAGRNRRPVGRLRREELHER